MLITSLCLTLILGVAGAAIDFGRAFQARQQTQSVMDAAVLAAGRVLQTTQSETDAIGAAQKYFDHMKSPILANATATFTIENNKSLVKGTVTGTVDTLLLGVMNFDSLAINVESRSEMAGGTNAGTNYEISLMLDVTGSMCDNGVGPCTNGTKITALKNAAADLVNIVIWDDQSVFSSRAAVVPFSTRIRVGPDGGGAGLMKVLTDLDAKWTGWYDACVSGSGSGGSEGGGDWTCNQYVSTHYSNWPVMPCVTDRTGPAEFTDERPGTNTWLNAHDGSRMVKSWDHTDTPPPEHVGNAQADPAWHWNYDGGGYCADVDQSNEILPLTSNKNTLIAKINSLTAYGATGGAMGTAWAWYMISPNWDNVWTGQSKPGSYSDLTTLTNGRPKLKKVAILMTDGEYNTFRGWKDSDQAMVSSHARSICTNMKAAGIEIYAVGFGLDELAADKRVEAENTLKSCGTDIQHFYNAFNVAQLQGAFRDIALKLAALRISK